MEIFQRILNVGDCVPEFEATGALRRALANPVPSRRGIVTGIVLGVQIDARQTRAAGAGSTACYPMDRSGAAFPRRRAKPCPISPRPRYEPQAQGTGRATHRLPALTQASFVSADCFLHH